MQKLITTQQLHDKYQSLEAIPYSEQQTEKSVCQLLAKTSQQYANKPALSFQLESHANAKSTTLNWLQVKQLTTQTANFFRSLGIGEQDVIAYMLPSLNETVITFMGGMTAGIVAPINPLLETEQIAALIKQTKAKVLVTLKAFPKIDLAQKARQVANQVECIETIVEIDLNKHLGAPKKWLIPFIRPAVEKSNKAKIVDFHHGLQRAKHTELDFNETVDDRICAFFHTGGTTGMPKITQHKQSGALYNGWLSSELLFNQNDTILCPLPLFHVFANYPVWMGCMRAGAHMVLPTPSGYRGEHVIKNFWKLIEKWRGTVFITVPTAAAMLIQQPLNANISSLSFIISGSAPFPTQLFEQFKHYIGVNVLEGYGMTETTCLIACNPIDSEQKVGSVGVPLPYTDVKIFQFNAQQQVIKTCQSNEIGEVCIANPGVIINHTYTEATKNKDLYAQQKFLRSGDLGRLDEDGYLWLTGRAKDLIIRGGHNIDPAIIEDTLAAHPEVAFAGAIGQPDKKSGEVPCVYVELRDNAGCSISALKAYAKQHIPEQAAMPKHIEILAELPKTAVGKIFKPALRKMAITRVYNAALADAGLNATVADIVKDDKFGQIIEINSSNNEQDSHEIGNVLGDFTLAWRLQ